MRRWRCDGFSAVSPPLHRIALLHGIALLHRIARLRPVVGLAAARLVLRYIASIAQPPPSKAARGLGSQPIVSAKYAIGPVEQTMITDVLLPEPAREELRRRWPHYLVVVPDGALHQLPLESLRVAGDPPRYLLDEMPPITYAPSAMIQAALAKVQEVVTGAVKIIARLTYRQRYEQSTGRDPFQCPHCGAEMAVWRMWHPTYGVIYDEGEVIKRGTYTSSTQRAGP